MLKLPIRSLVKPTITQAWGNTSYNAWYKANGITSPYHNGIDLAIGTARDTYGTPIVCPFKEAEVYLVVFDNPIATKGNGVYLQAYENGMMFRIVVWHTGEVSVKVGDKLKEGEVICYIGNSGLCGSVQPDGSVKTISIEELKKNPWLSAHLHFMLQVYLKDQYGNWILQDADNGVGGWIDPLRYFDKNLWYYGVGNEDKHDIPPFTEILKGMGIVEAIQFMFKYWKITR